MSTFELMVEGIIYDLEAWSGSERGLALLCLKNFRSYFFFFFLSLTLSGSVKKNISRHLQKLMRHLVTRIVTKDILYSEC